MKKSSLVGNAVLSSTLKSYNRWHLQLYEIWYTKHLKFIFNNTVQIYNLSKHLRATQISLTYQYENTKCQKLRDTNSIS